MLQGEALKHFTGMFENYLMTSISKYFSPTALKFIRGDKVRKYFEGNECFLNDTFPEEKQKVLCSITISSLLDS